MKSKKLLTAGLLAVSILSVGSVAFAANEVKGSTAALQDTEYTLEEMLVYALEDEYNGMAEYEAMVEKFGSQRPYSNLVRAEEKHIDLLLNLFEDYKLTAPAASEYEGTVPESLEAGYEAGIAAEKSNVAMYEKFLKEDLTNDVKEIFEALKAASERHIQAFENALEGNLENCPNGLGNGRGRGNGLRNGACGGRGNGIGNGNQRRGGGNGLNNGVCNLL